MAGRNAVGAKGYFDIEVTCEGPFAQPPRACFLDGLQVATGATWGKRTLHWVEADRIAVHFKNTRTGKTVTLLPARPLLESLASLKPQPKSPDGPVTAGQPAHAQLESMARKIASMPQSHVTTMAQGE